MSHPHRTAPLPSEAQLLHRAGGRASFKPGKGGAAGGESRRKVGSGWNGLSTPPPGPATAPAPSAVAVNQAANVQLDDFEDDEQPAINPARLAAGSHAKQPRKPSPSTSRWAGVSANPAPRPSPNPAFPSRAPSGPFPPVVSASYSSFPTALPPSPPHPAKPAPRHTPNRPFVSQSNPSSVPHPAPRANGFSGAPAPSDPNRAHFAGPPARPAPVSRTPSASATRQPQGPPSPSTSQTGVPRTTSHPGSSRRATPGPGGGGGGTGTSRWATPAAVARQRDQPPHAAAAAAAAAPPSVPPFSASSPPQTNTPPEPLPAADLPAVSQTPTSSPSRPTPKAVESAKPAGKHEIRHEPRPVQQDDQAAGSVPNSPLKTSTTAQLPPPVPIVENSAPPPSLPHPAPSNVSPTSLTSTRSPARSPTQPLAPKPPSAAAAKPVPAKPAPAPATSPVVSALPQKAPLPPRALLPGYDRVATGGAKKNKKSPEELEALMAKMRLKNEEAMKKRQKAEEDKQRFDEIAEQERKRSEELERKVREERERLIREERERKERTIELQKEINRAREEAAQRKLALIQGRAWDAEKLERERDPYGEGGSGRELQYPSAERRAGHDLDHEGEGEEVVAAEDAVLTEEERRRRDGVRNDEQAWETVQHFEGKGRAQLVVK
ncbi:hypothetical protein JCM11491_006935 [Sporobolomyces phaffii]